MDLRLATYAPNGGGSGLLPAPDSFQFAVPLNDVPGLTLNYATVAPRAGLLGQPLELAVEVSSDGGNTWTEPDDCRFLYLRDGRDPIRTADAYQIEAPGYVWRLQKARLLSEGHAIDGRRTFAGTTVGAILRTLWTEATARGALSGMTLEATATHDAAGTPWPDTGISRDYELGADYLTILRDMADAGLLDFRMAGRTLKLYVTDTVMATDRTTGNSQVHLTPLRLTEAPFRRTWEGLADFIHVQGDDGASVAVTNGAALKPWGRWEDFITQGGVADDGTLTALAQRYQTTTAAERAEFTQAMAVAGDGPRPLIDFQPGDYLWSRDLAGTRTKFRVRQVTLEKTGNTVQGNVVLNDRFLEEDIRVHRAINALTGGASSGGSTGGTPIPPGADILRPAAPAQPGATSSAYVDANGIVQAQVTLDWPDVTTNIDGTPITDLAGYVVWELAPGDIWRERARIGTDSLATLSPYAPDTAMQFRVRAYDTAGNESPLSPIIAIITATDNTPPTAPSVPTATSINETADVSWDGENAVGNPLDDPDLARVELHGAYVSGFTPLVNDSTTKLGNYDGPGRLTLTGLAAGTRLYLRLMSVDTSGNGTPGAETFVDIVGASDGNPPAPPPGWTASLKPLGIMALQASWPAVPNADPVTYRVYLDDGGVPDIVDPDTLVGETAATNMAIQRHPFGAPLTPGTTYAARVVPVDADGEGAISDETPESLSQVREADETSISSEYVYAGEIEARQIRSGGLDADLAILKVIRTAAEGRNISLSSVDGLRAQDQSGNTLAHIPTDPSLNLLMLLDVIAQSITATGPVALRAGHQTVGGPNELATNAALILKSGTAAPVTPPTPQLTWRHYGPGNAEEASWYGGAHIANGTLYQAWAIYNGATGVDFINPDTGVVTGGFQVPPANGKTYTVHAVVRANSGKLFTLETISDPSYQYPLLFLCRRSATGSLESTVPAYSYDFRNRALPALGMVSGGDQPVLALPNPATNQILLDIYDANGFQVTSQGALAYPSLGTTKIGSVLHGSFDFDTGGSPRWVITTRDRAGGDLILIYNPGTGARETTREWDVANDDAIAGMAWDPTSQTFKHRSRTTGKYYEYDGTYWTTGGKSEQWRIANTWYDSDPQGDGPVGAAFHQTTIGPPALVQVKKRARVQVTTPPIPTDPNAANHDDANAVRVYASRSGTLTTDYFLQAAPADGVTTVQITRAVFSNADTLHPNPPSAGNFPNGTPARIETDSGAYYWDGEGDAELRGLHVDGLPVHGQAPIVESSGPGGTYNPGTAANLQTPAGLADLTFVAPPSGRVRIVMNMFILSKTAGAVTYFYPRVREGATQRAGTIVRDNANLDSVANYGTTYIKMPAECTVDGLTPGEDYNVHPVCHTSSANGATWTLGVVKVIPA